MKRFNWFVVIGIAFFLTLSLDAQDCDKENYYELGKNANREMYVHINKRDLNSAVEACIKKEKLFFKSESWKDYIKALNDKAYLYHAVYNLELLKESVFINIKEADKYLQSDHPQWLRAKEQINSYYYIIGDYKNALEIIKEVIPIKEKLKLSKVEIGNSYLNLGTAYTRLKDNENALSSFKKSIKVLYGDGKLGLRSGERYNNIARVFKAKGELDSALYNLRISESLFDTIKVQSKFKRKRVEAYILLVETWLDKKDYEKAKYYLDLTRELPLSNIENVIWYETLARFYREIEDFEKSKESILKAISLSEEHSTRNSPPLRSKRNIELTKTLIQNAEFEQALIVVSNGLQVLAPTFKDNGIHSNPLPEFFLDKPDALILLQEKARILNEKYLQNDSLKYLKSSFDTYVIACDVIKDVRQGIRSTDSKNDLSERSISVYEEAIHVAYKLFNITKDEEYIFIAFKLAESNKAQLLLENLNEQEARGFAGIPDSLSAKEKGQRLYLAALEDRAIREGRDSDNYDKIFQIRQKINQFSSFLEKSYPRYYKQKYNNDPIDPAFVQENILDSKKALIEYFVGIENIYVFVITKDLIFMDEIPKGSLDMEQIIKFRNLLKNRPGNESPETEYSEFVKSSRSVYVSFVKNALDKLPKSINTLIVVPDDQINFIPFEVLLLDDPKVDNSYSLSSQSYLFEDYAVNYNYSATLLSKVIEKDETDFTANFIGYAPTFKEESISVSRSSLVFELSNLKCNKDEVSSIESIIGGEKRIDGDATKDNFLNEAKNYKIIHLATHAFVNLTDSKLNRIFLQDDFLSEVNLYNLELNTELVVLSACNTGSGELLKGEGVMNLARGFINAGCSSTLMSMWAVDDCATADLMLLFYKGIKNGLNKDEALRRAKIEYLTTANKTKLHPYYWAAFIPFGDMKPMELNDGWYKNSALPVGLCLVSFAMLFFYFRSHNS